MPPIVRLAARGRSVVGLRSGSFPGLALGEDAAVVVLGGRRLIAAAAPGEAAQGAEQGNTVTADAHLCKRDAHANGWNV